MVKITIDGMSLEVPADITILEAARTAGINIPTLCYLKDINEIAACRICVVEVEGVDRLVPACNTKVEEGMVVLTNTNRVKENRKINLQLILSQHNSNCPTCVRNGNCTLQRLAAESNLSSDLYSKKISSKPWSKDNHLIRDESKCIKCMRCIQICDKVQKMNVWDVINTGSRTTVGVSGNRKFNETDCTLCGQCITHCPVGALRVNDDTSKVIAALTDPEITTVVQVAPAVRAAWGEHLGLTKEQATTGRMVAALRRLGFDYIFDTNFAADLTVMEEGSEFIERFTHKSEYAWPMLTSCCPGWVRFVKGNFPQYTDNLSTAKSPQQMFGAAAKSYFAEKVGIDPKKIFVVSIMPCVAKKSECKLPAHVNDNGDPDVDVVLTTREFQRMLLADKADLGSLPESEFDSPLGQSSGAGLIFGATGGVMIAALRSAYYLVTGKNPDADAFSSIGGKIGWSEAVFTIPGAGEVKVAVVSGLSNARALMEAIETGKVAYDFVEVMACPGGCAGGGGQPIHDGFEMAAQRGDILWELDKKAANRFSHENPDIQALYRDYFEKPLSEKAHHLLHTDHHTWEMPKKK
ncbi:MAG: hydrogenase [Ruminococcaceae bacterium]|nr:hydrogenase [Oscillospiraceae bacterium]